MNDLRRIAAGAPVAADPNSFDAVLAARLSRRQALLGGLSATAMAVLGSTSLIGCTDDNDDEDGDDSVTPPLATALGFTAVAKNRNDVVSIPAGYTATTLLRLGDPLTASTSAYRNDGTDSDFSQRAGDHHDGMHFFGMDSAGRYSENAVDRGLLVMNHENITEIYLHVNGPSPAPRPESEARKEIEAHGVSVVEVAKGSNGRFAYVQSSTFNRRITPFTPIQLNGPVAGSAYAKTAYSPTGAMTRGTINNCANGYTPWGTYLTCEENWAGYFRRAADDDSKRSATEVVLLKRSGTNQGAAGSNAWATVTPASASETGYSRWDISLRGSSTDGTDDFRNEAYTYGYIVEIDPFNPSSVPRKRTALGRFGHEGAWPAEPVSGQPLVFYMGDDSRGEYVYKWVSDALWNPADATGGLAAGDKYLDAGTLYVAKFAADGSGQWIALKQGQNGLTAANTLYPFASQADIAVATRLAADSVGATRMDRPEWAAVNPANGEVYLTLTNNANRGSSSNQPLDAANPRAYSDFKGTREQKGNVNGHIIRWKEDGNQASLTFKWDVYVFGAQADADATNVNLSSLTDDNDMSSPDGLAFGPNGLIWIQTDDGAYTDVTNCMMLAAVPGAYGDGAAKDVVSGTTTTRTYVGKAPGTNLRRFLVGPVECEITGITWTPDGKAMFVNIQHPGEAGSLTSITSHFPDGGTSRPRSATVVITKDDGGVIGV